MRRTLLILALSGLMVGAIVDPTTPAAAVQSPHDRVVRDLPASFTPNVLDGQVNAIVQVGSTMIIGGQFSQVQAAGSTTTLTRNNILAFNATTGALSTTFLPTIDGEITALLVAPDGQSVYAGGFFNNVNGTPSQSLARISVANGQRVPGFTPPSMNGRVKDLRLTGGRLWVAGTFSAVAGTARTGLYTANPSTGTVDPYMGLTIAGVHNGGTTQVLKMDVTPDGSRLIAIGNFLTVNGQPRDQIFMLTLTGPTAALANWQTNFYTSTCASVFNTYMRDLDISPEGSYVVISTTGSYVSPPASCDTTARFETGATGSGLSPTWVDYTGGDTSYAVAITGIAVYVGGHFRWQNNPLAGDRAGPGAVSREGIAALDPANGLPLSWNPGRTKGVGVFDMLATPQGLWVGSDTDRIGHFSYRARIALMPLAGGTIIPPNLTGTLPGEVYQAGRLTSLNANDVVHRSFDGDVPGSTATLPPTGIAWSNARGAVMIRDVVYYGWSDGNFYSRTFDGMNFGPQTAVNTHDLIVSLASWHSDIPNITSMFFQGGRLYYTLSNSSSLFYRYFTPENRVVGTLRFTASNSVAGVDFSQAGGAFLTGDKLYLANRITGALTRVDFVNSAPVAGTATVVSGPALDGADWRTRALFLSTVGVTPPANQPPVAASNVTCTGLDCIVSGANSTDPDGSIESYTWNFGDGTTGSGVSTTHSYAKAGTYQVQLTVTDNQGATNSTTQTVAVAYNAAFDLSSDAVFRVQGPDRVATAIDASQFLFGDAPSGAEAVVLARSDLFPDALAGVPLAAASTGPLLITPPTQLDSRVAAEIQRILPLDKPVYLLGGTGALSQAVEDQVRALGYTTVTRLAGPDRFATALAIALQVEQVLGGPPTVVLVATGQNFPDALAAGAAAGAGGVVVMSNDATLPQPVRDYVVQKQQVDNAFVATVGGPAVPSYPEADAAISGADRYQTAALVADFFFVVGGEGPLVAGLATGTNFPDALSGGAVMALIGGPMLLTNPTTLNAHPQAFLTQNRVTIDAALIFGSGGAVSTIVDGQVAAAIAD